MQFILIILLFFGAVFLYGTVTGPLAQLFGMFSDAEYQEEKGREESRFSLFTQKSRRESSEQLRNTTQISFFPSASSQTAGVVYAGANTNTSTDFPRPILNRAGTFEGALILNQQGFAFRPCGSFVWYWLLSSNKLNDLTTRYHIARNTPIRWGERGEVRAILYGIPTKAPRSGDNSEYAYAFHVEVISSIDANKACVR